MSLLSQKDRKENGGKDVNQPENDHGLPRNRKRMSIIFLGFLSASSRFFLSIADLFYLAFPVRLYIIEIRFEKISAFVISLHVCVFEIMY